MPWSRKCPLSAPIFMIILSRPFYTFNSFVRYALFRAVLFSLYPRLFDNQPKRYEQSHDKTQYNQHKRIYPYPLTTDEKLGAVKLIKKSIANIGALITIERAVIPDFSNVSLCKFCACVKTQVTAPGYPNS